MTIVATLLMVERALEAAETLAAEGIEAEVIDLRWIRPLDLADRQGIGREDRTPRSSPRSRSTRRLGRDGHLGARPGRRPVRGAAAPRQPADDYPIPYTPPLEDLVVPSADAIAAAARAAAGR